jgi:predicted nucleotidyltransferase
MHEILEDRIEQLRERCRDRHVRRLEAFGSAVGGDFDPATSDVDFRVDFESLSPAAYAKAYFGLLGDLQDMFRRNVDLIEVDAIRNPFFLRTIADQRVVLYAA